MDRIFRWLTPVAVMLTMVAGALYLLEGNTEKATLCFVVAVLLRVLTYGPDAI